MMRRLAADLFEQPGKVELGKTRLVGDVVEVDRGGIMSIDKELCSNDTPVQILFWVAVLGDHDRHQINTEYVTRFT